MIWVPGPFTVKSCVTDIITTALSLSVVTGQMGSVIPKFLYINGLLSRPNNVHKNFLNTGERNDTSAQLGDLYVVKSPTVSYTSKFRDIVDSYFGDFKGTLNCKIIIIINVENK